MNPAHGSDQSVAHARPLAVEAANWITHGLGLALSIAGAAVLVALTLMSGDGYSVAGCAIYGGTLVFMYLASTLYHSVRRPGVKRFFRRLDHSAIYLLIAGTYTPFALMHLRAAGGLPLLITFWALAMAGVLFKVFWLGKHEFISTISYLGMGWLGVLTLKPLLATVPGSAVAGIVAGGVFYTVGVVFYAWKRLPYHHAIWHLFVLAGSACHYIAVLYSVPHTA